MTWDDLKVHQSSRAADETFSDRCGRRFSCDLVVRIKLNWRKKRRLFNHRNRS